MTETMTKTVSAKAENAGKSMLSALSKAAKAKDRAGAVDLLAGAAVLFGSPSEALDNVTKAEDLIAEGRALLADSTPKARQWIAVARHAKAAGVTVRQFAEATKTNPNTLGRLTRAGDLFDAAREAGKAITLGEAIRRANVMGAGDVTKALAVLSDGGDPFAEETEGEATPAEPKAKTVEAYVKRLDALADMLSDLTDGFATPKADTLTALERQAETLARIVKQHAALTAAVRKAGKTPKAA